MNKIKLYKTLAFVLLALFTTQLNAQEWVVPEDKASVSPDITFSEQTQMQGKDLYLSKCKSCHGDIGGGNFLPLAPPPGDPASEQFSSQTDGSLFYKLSEGRGGMPAFKSQISEPERWAIVSYFRTFHKDYVPSNASQVVVEESDNYKGKDVALSVVFNKADDQAIVEATGTLNGQKVPANGVRIGFFVKRNFGYMKIGDPVTTNAEGLAKANFPKNIPGDSIGNYDVLVKLIDEDIYGKIEYRERVAMGEHFVAENPLDHRSLWGNRSSAPLWLLFTYFGVVALVWGTIIWVVLQIVKLRKLA